MYNEYHVTFLVGDDGVLMCGCVVKELLASSHCFVCRLCLGGCYCTECHEHGGVYGLPVVQEDSNYFLDDFFLGGG